MNVQLSQRQPASILIINCSPSLELRDLQLFDHYNDAQRKSPAVFFASCTFDASQGVPLDRYCKQKGKVVKGDAVHVV